MPFTIDHAACFASAVGKGGLDDATFERSLGTLAPAVAGLAQQRDDGSLPLLQVPDQSDDLGPLRDVAGTLMETCSHVVVLGTGGSSLGGQTLNALVDRGFGPPAGRPQLIFLDNVDPDSFSALFTSVDLSRLGVIAISKSGGTAETLCQFAILLHALLREIDEARLAARVAVITEPKESPLKTLAERFRLPTLDHDTGVGGRFSVLTNVGLLPACLAGLDLEALRGGAARVLEDTLSATTAAGAGPAVGAAVSIGLQRANGVTQTILMPYLDRLAHFGLWYRQLWAESLGKDGQGTTPIRAMGTVDQHSQLQLYLAGPWDKMFSVLRMDTKSEGRRVDPELLDDPRLDYLAGRRMGDLLDAEARATADTLIRNGRPTRQILIETLDEDTLGGLFMHFMLETILAAHLLEVNPFDQPAVEEGKVLAREYLERIAP
ncbi:glucose-6-phosphate isomerase [Algihabitans albus]|uniref:glucose-6-phosphate isomerase n=1 Tax=Algihabitans albus TaxID=2164067 RepID=UPI0035CEC9F7